MKHTCRAAERRCKIFVRGQVCEARSAHRSKYLDEVVRPAHRGVEPRRLRYDRRRDTDRGPEKHAGHSPPSWLSTPLFSDLIVVPDARAGEARCVLSCHDIAQRCPGMPGCCRLAPRRRRKDARSNDETLHGRDRFFALLRISLHTTRQILKSTKGSKLPWGPVRCGTT